MRILFDNQIFELQKFGGVSRYFNELLKMSGTDLLVERIIGDVAQAEIPRMAETDLFSRGMRYIKRKAGISAEAVLQDNYSATIAKLEKSDFDLFHPTYFDPYFLDAVRKPFVVTVYDMIHEICSEFYSPGDKTSTNKRLLCNRAAAVITISETTKNDLISLFKTDQEKVHAIPLASDFDQIIASRPSRLDGIENYILYTGARWAYKNFYFTALAISDLLKQDRTLQLLCTGHEFSKEEHQFFSGLGIGSQVRHIYLKTDNELAWVYKNARVFIFPSLYEGFGFPLLEAFATDCPVVSSDRGSLKEVGGNGPIYFDPKKINQVQDALHSALYNSEARNGMIERGRQQFKKFSWDKCRLQTAAVYRSIVNN